ncbi:hypothetical protein PYW07_006115 [Mythimna separata]|uniref:Uncharacterized protein n=1 Tax=Mythimna separata TaxID=271217 RepID=A0AAD8DSR5_MYTSE|nr:hypothetical protein PYW07_006115 [Mythimna separata]
MFYTTWIDYVNLKNVFKRVCYLFLLVCSQTSKKGTHYLCLAEYFFPLLLSNKKMSLMAMKIKYTSGCVILLRNQSSIGRPPTRWTDNLARVAGIRWMRDAQDRSLWRRLGEAYVQQWTSFG